LPYSFRSALISDF